MHKIRTLPTLERLKELLRYDLESGLFYHLKARQKVKIGDIAGTVKAKYLKPNKSYILIGIDGIQYYAHRLAWLYVTGEEPKNLVDHKDCDGLNNKWLNLREATRQENGRNSVKINNKLGLKGIAIQKNGKYLVRVCIGTYSNLEDAVTAYNEAIAIYHGEFARLSVIPKEVQPNA